jgi:hypothetical protein
MPGMGMPGMGMPGQPGGGMPGVPGGGNRPGLPGTPGGEAGGPGGLPDSGFGPGFPGGMADSGVRIHRTEYIDIDKLESRHDIRLAERIYPVHVAMITASFPYKQQWEEFRRALRKRTMNEVFDLNQRGEAPFEFKGFEIQRRVLLPNGQVKQDWTDYTKTWIDTNKGLFIRAVDREQDDPKLKPLIYKGLAGPRPKLARDLKYPDVDLKGIKDTLEALDKAAKDNLPPPPPPQGGKFKGQGFDPADPDAFDPDAPGQPTQPSNQPKKEKPDSSSSLTEGPGIEASLPDQVLVRFLDPEILEGYTYQYRFKVKMLNPNFERKSDVAFPSLAKPKELVAKDWWPTTNPLSVTVSTDTQFYVVNEKPERGVHLHTTRPADKDHVALQMHRWVGYELSNPENPDSRYGFGEWSILDRDIFTRGEYIRRMVTSEVPLWRPDFDQYVLATSTRREKKIPLEFTTQSRFSNTPAILVDFDGGSVRYQAGPKIVQDEVPVQALILTPEGKLVVRSGARDTEDEGRAKRVEDWRKFVKDVKSGKRIDNKGNRDGGLFPGGGNRGSGLPGSS